MKISDLFKTGSLDQNRAQELKESNRNREQEVAKQSGGQKGTDTDSVNISPLARELFTIQKIVNEDDSLRASRVANLKEQVAAGNYTISSKDVATSIVSFAKDGENQG